MKTLNIILFILLFLPKPTLAQELSERSTASISTVLRLEYEQYQANALDLLDAKVGDLLSIARKIREDSALSMESKKELQDSITSEINIITRYKQRLEDADTSEELRELFKEAQSRKTYSYFVRKTKMLLLLGYFETSLEQLTVTTKSIDKTIQNLNMNPKRKEKVVAVYEEMAIRLATLKHAVRENKEKLNKTTNTSYEEVFADVRSDISTMGEEFGVLKKNIKDLRIEFKNLQK